MRITHRVFTILALIALAGLAILFTGCGDDDTPAGPADPGGADIYVDGPNGNDSGSGSGGSPYKTITKALSAARSGDIITVRPGIYDAVNGETFPINVTNGVTLQGTDWERCTIKIDAETQGTRYAVVLNGTDCTIRNFTLEEQKITDSFVTYFVNVTGCTNALVDSLRTLQRVIYGAIRIDTDNGSTIQNCYFNDNEAGYHERAIAIFGNGFDDHTTIRHMTITGYIAGILFASPQSTLVEHCNFTGNQYGADIGSYGEPSTQPNPDFGGGARGGAGNNNFSGLGSYGILNHTRHTIYAKFNTWAHNPPTSGVDFWNSDEAGGGSVVWQ